MTLFVKEDTADDLLHQVTEELFEQIMRRSAAAAAVTVSRPGADPPALAELAELAAS